MRKKLIAWFLAVSMAASPVSVLATEVPVFTDEEAESTASEADSSQKFTDNTSGETGFDDGTTYEDPIADVPIEKTKGVKSIQITSAIPSQGLLEYPNNETGYNLNAEVILTDDTIINVDNIRYIGNSYSLGENGEYGALGLRYVNENGETISPITSVPGIYNLQVYYKEDESIASPYIKINLESIKEMKDLPVPTEEGLLETKLYTNIKEKAFLAKIPASQERRVLKITNLPSNEGIESRAYTRICRIGDGNIDPYGMVDVLHGDVFTAEPGVDYYLYATCNNPSETMLQYRLEETKELVKIEMVNPPEDKIFIKEFWNLYNPMEGVQFKLTFSDGTTEVVTETSQYCGKIRTFFGENLGEVFVTCEGAPSIQLEFRFKNIIPAIEAGDICTDITNFLDDGNLHGINTDLTENKAYFYFRVPENGSYKFKKRYANRVCIAKNEEFASDFHYDTTFTINASAGDIIYGCAYTDDNRQFEVSVSKATVEELPEIASIELADGKLKCDRFYSGVLYYGRKGVFNGTKLKITYRTPEIAPEYVTVGSYEEKSKYYGVANAVHNSFSYKQGIADIQENVIFVLENQAKLYESEPYSYTCLDERKHLQPSDQLGEFEIIYDEGDYAMYSFKAPQEGRYSFELDGGKGYISDSDEIIIYPRNFRDNPTGDDIRYDGFRIENKKAWVEKLNTGQEICIAVYKNQHEVSSNLKINKVDLPEISALNMPEEVIEEFSYEELSDVKIQLNYPDGKQQVYSRETEHPYFGNIILNYDTANGEVTYYFSEADYIKTTSYKIKEVSLAEKEGEIPTIAAVDKTYSVPLNYNGKNLFAVNMPEDGYYCLDISSGETDLSENVTYMVNGKIAGNPGSTMKLYQNQKVFLAVIGADQDISVKIRRMPGIKGIQFHGDTQSSVSGTYVADLILKWDDRIEQSYFNKCKFDVTSETPDGGEVVETYGFGDNVPGFGRIAFSWPTDPSDPDILQTGSGLEGYFYISGTDVKCPLPGISIDYARNLEIANVKNGRLEFVENSADPGLAKTFEFNAVKDQLYKISFEDNTSAKKSKSFTPQAENTVFAASSGLGDSVKRGTELQLVVTRASDTNTPDIYVLEELSQNTCYISLGEDDIVSGKYLGDKQAVVVEPVDSSESFELKINEPVKILVGDYSYSYRNCNCTINDEPYGSDSEAKYGKIIAVPNNPNLDIVKAEGQYGVQFKAERNDLISCSGMIQTVLPQNAGLTEISEGESCNLENASKYDGKSAAVFTVTNSDLYEYRITFKENSQNRVLIYYDEMGRKKEIFYNEGTISLENGSYAFVDTNDAVSSITLKRLTEPTPTPPTPEPEPEPDPNPDPPIVYPPISTPTPTPKPVPENMPEGSRWEGDILVTPNGTQVKPDGTIVLPNGTEFAPDKNGVKPTIDKDGTVAAPDGTKVTADGTTYRPDGGITSPTGEVVKPAFPVLSEVKAAGNQAAVTLKEKGYGAEGYDYVIGKSADCIKTRKYVKVNKNLKETKTSFPYLPKGTYYAYCHSWKLDENGKKVFSSWSEPIKLKITATTPGKPRILKAEVKGRNVTITYRKASNTSGYDIILGKRVKKIDGEVRPVDYGKYVIKNVNKNTVRVTFKNVKPGTYYVGMHSFNRTSTNKSKVFSPWSNRIKVRVR